MIFSSLFKRKKSKTLEQKSSYASTVEFVDDNLPDVKTLLSSAGYNSLTKRLDDLANMLSCQVVILCQKTQGPNKYVVLESSNRPMCQRGTMFTWSHTSATASSEAQTVISALPFAGLAGTSFISAPVKNERNVLTGVLIGISLEKLGNLDSKTRLLHLMAPLFEAEIRCWKYRQDIRQMEQRVESLNQSIEVRNADLQKAQESSLANRELKSIFLTNLSHEIRTPMNAIIGFVNLLQTTDDALEREKFIDIIKQSSTQALTIIDNLIEISKLQSSYMLKPACPVQLNMLLNNIKEKYADELRKEGKDVAIVTNYALETPNDTIWNSDEIISKVMEQLMENSCRYTHTGKITISYTMNHKEATFCITDTGAGIKPGNEENIFELFGSNGLENDGNRSGIGLALARKYVMLTNGQIWVDTSYHDGACFYFSIPAEKL